MPFHQPWRRILLKKSQTSPLFPQSSRSLNNHWTSLLPTTWCVKPFITSFSNLMVAKIFHRPPFYFKWYQNFFCHLYSLHIAVRSFFRHLSTTVCLLRTGYLPTPMFRKSRPSDHTRHLLSAVMVGFMKPSRRLRPKGGNCNVFRNVLRPTTFDATELRLRKPKGKKTRM